MSAQRTQGIPCNILLHIHQQTNIWKNKNNQTVTSKYNELLHKIVDGGNDCVEAISGCYLRSAATVKAGFNFLYILVSSLIFEQGIESPDPRAVTYGRP
jgi:hypothetical protein